MFRSSSFDEVSGSRHNQAFLQSDQGCYGLTNSLFSSVNWPEGEGRMFEQLDDPKLAGRKSWKERLSEAAVILVVVAVVIGILVYVLMSK